MDTRQIFGVCSAIPFIILGIVMLLGKGDKLITQPAKKSVRR